MDTNGDNEELLHPGSMAPDFMLPDQDGHERALSDYQGRWVFLFFYPKDGTPGCIEEVCAIRDYFPAFVAANATVLGVSADSAESHKEFAIKHDLPFLLLSDKHKKVVERYGVYRRAEVMSNAPKAIIRKSFLINVMGEIEKMYENLKPREHAEAALRDLAELEAPANGKE